MENMENIGFLERENYSLVEQVKKYETSEAKLNQKVLVEQRDTFILLMANDSLVKEVNKYQISQAPLNKTVLELEQTNQDLHRKWWAVQDKNYVLEHEIFDVGQENKRLADENKRLADETNVSQMKIRKFSRTCGTQNPREHVCRTRIRVCFRTTA